MATPSENMRGAALMVGSMVAFTVNDTMMKALGDFVPFFQALFFRGVGTVTAMVALGLVLGLIAFQFSASDRLWIGVRSSVEAAAAYFFITGIFNMPLANASAILQVLPLTVTLASALFLGEQVGWRRWSLIGIGFIGVMLIVQPGAEGFTIYSVYILAAVVCVTVRDIATRKLSRDASSFTVALIGGIVVTLFAGVGTVLVDRAPVPGSDATALAWVTLDFTSWALLIGTIVSIIAAYLFSVQTMRQGDIGFIAPFRYSSLIAALILGYAVFGDWPDNLTLIGATIVVISGYISFRREQQLAKETTAPPKG